MNSLTPPTPPPHHNDEDNFYHHNVSEGTHSTMENDSHLHDIPPLLNEDHQQNERALADHTTQPDTAAQLDDNSLKNVVFEEPPANYSPVVLHDESDEQNTSADLNQSQTPPGQSSLIQSRAEQGVTPHPQQQSPTGQHAHTRQLNSLIFLQKKLFHLVDQYLNLQTTLKNHLAMQCHKSPLHLQAEAFDNIHQQVLSILEINRKKANTLTKARDELFTEIWMLKNRSHVLRHIVDALETWIDGGAPVDFASLQKEIDEKVLLRNTSEGEQVTVGDKATDDEES